MSLTLHVSRFVLAGGMLTVLGYFAILLLTHAVGLDPYVANFSVYVAGLYASYWLNAKFVFRHSPALATFWKFLLSFLVAYIANFVTLAALLRYFDMPHWGAQLAATFVYAMMHFVINRGFVFEWDRNTSNLGGVCRSKSEVGDS